MFDHRAVFTALLCCSALALCSLPAAAADEIRGARFPALSPDGRTLLFCYWGDIWAQPADGSSSAHRLTDHLAWDWQPRFSPDGRYIAFNSTRGGNQDVWVMPAEGGAAWPVTDFSGSDTLGGWSPDSKSIVFSSTRHLWSSDIFEVDMRGELQPTQLTGLDHYGADEPQLMADGSVVYSRGSARWWRKRYQGTAQNDLWRVTPEGTYTQITNTRFPELWPMGAGGGALYFASEEDGIGNLWSLDISSATKLQLTQHSSDGVQWPSLQPGGDSIVYEFDGWLYRVSTTGGEPLKLPVLIASETKNSFTEKRSFRNEASEYSVSPNGRYAAFILQGDLWAIKDPEAYDEDEKPDQDLEQAWRLTASDGARERYPAFSPDNLHIVYSSDSDGDYELYRISLSDMQVEQLTHNSVDDLAAQFAAADSNVVFHYSGNRDIVRLDMESGESSVLASGRFRGGFDYYGFAVSPDGTWIAYVNEMPDWSNEIFVVDSGGIMEPVNITRDPASEGSPNWSQNGRWLSYARSGDDSRNMIVVELDPRSERLDTEFLFEDDRPSKDNAEAENSGPGLGADDEEEDGEDEDEDEDEADEAEDSRNNGGKKEELSVEIDFEDIHLRGRHIDSYVGSFLISGDYAVYETNPPGGKPQVKSKKIEGGDAETLFDGDWSDPQLAEQGKRIYYLDSGTVRYAKFGKGKSSGRGELSAKGDFWLDKRARWRQMFTEAHRTLGQRFYDPAMHGVDWAGVYDKYAPYIEGIGTPEEFSYVFQEVLGELNASHLGITMGESSYSGTGPQSCHLGLEFDESFDGPGKRVSHVTYRGPADRPGVDIEPGDILLEINGQEVDSVAKWQTLLNDTAGKPVELTIFDASEQSERSVLIKPISYGEWQGNLLYREWEIMNEAYVERLSGGRVGYIHIRGMSRGELRKFERELYAELLGKEALLVDVRFNPGGFIHEDLFEILDRNPFALAGHRDEEPILQPARIFDKPKALLINARSGSDAEIFPSGWRILELGPIVGIDTYGAVIGTTGFSLVDGTYIRLPIEGWWELDGRNLELSGTPPDVYLDVHPAALRQGIDTQLEKAVELLMEELE